MKYCKNCGKGIDDNSIFCQYCGTRANGDDPHSGGYNGTYGGFGGFGGFNNPYGSYPVYDMTGSKLVTLISFLSWEIGLILYLVWRRSRPGKAESAAKGAIAKGCMNMPILGLALWLVWREEYNRQQYAKIAGISAIVGTALYALLMVCAVLLGGLDAGMSETVNEGMTALISFIG